MIHVLSLLPPEQPRELVVWHRRHGTGVSSTSSTSSTSLHLESFSESFSFASLFHEREDVLNTHWGQAQGTGTSQVNCGERGGASASGRWLSRKCVPTVFHASRTAA